MPRGGSVGAGASGGRDAASGGGSRGRDANAASRGTAPSTGGGRGGRRSGRTGATARGGPQSRGTPGQRAGTFVSGLFDQLNQMMTPDMSDPRNVQPGALGMLPGLGMAMGAGMAIHGIGEALGIEVGPAPEHTPGEQPGDPPIAPEDETDSPQPVLTPEEEQERLRMRGLQWYSGLMSTGIGSAPGA